MVTDLDQIQTGGIYFSQSSNRVSVVVIDIEDFQEGERDSTDAFEGCDLVAP